MKALVLGMVSLGFACGAGASGLDEEFLRFVELGGMYWQRVEEVMTYVRPLLDRVQELKKLINNLEEGKKALRCQDVHDEKCKRQETAVNRLLNQYKQEFDDLYEAIYVKFDPVGYRKNVELYQEYFDRSMEFIRNKHQSTNK